MQIFVHECSHVSSANSFLEKLHKAGAAPSDIKLHFSVYNTASGNGSRILIQYIHSTQL